MLRIVAQPYTKNYRQINVSEEKSSSGKITPIGYLMPNDTWKHTFSALETHIQVTDWAGWIYIFKTMQQ